MIGENGSPTEVLLVEDSPGDVRLTQEAFRVTNNAIRIHVASDGVDAIAFLRRQGPHNDVPRPDVILLARNLPKMDGREVLAHIKEDESLKMIPTVIHPRLRLTSSAATSLQANGYLNKPLQLEAFEMLVKNINDFWLNTVKLPLQIPV
jgi:chemotaxis family two-component system response regulator Rcp1